MNYYALLNSRFAKNIEGEREREREREREYKVIAGKGRISTI